MYEDKRKLSKRRYMTVVQGEKGSPTPGYNGGSSIYHMHQCFTLRLKHLKGSNRPAGHFHDGYSSRDGSVEIRWLWTEEHGFFAPEMTVRPTELGLKVVAKVGKALRSIPMHGYDDDKEDRPTQLIDLLEATVVQYMDDNKEGCWDDYRPLRIPGEPAMVTLARYAS